jgi:hypothetical protein
MREGKNEEMKEGEKEGGLFLLKPCIAYYQHSH